MLGAGAPGGGVSSVAARPIDRRLLGEAAVRWSVAVSVALGLVSAATVVVQAVVLAGLLSTAMGSSSVRPLPAVLWLAGAAAVRAACALTAEATAARGAEAAKAALRRRLLDAVLSPGRTGSAGAAEVATIAGRGLDALDTYIGRCLPDLVLAAVVPIALAVVIGVLDWVSAAVVAVVLLLFPLFGFLVGAASGDLAARRWRQVEAFGRQVADVFDGLPVLKALGHSARQRERIARAGEALSMASLSTLRVAFLSALVLDTLASVSVALVAVPLGLRLLDGSVSLAAALAVLIVAPEVFLPLRRATAEFHESTEGLAAARRAMDVIAGAERPAAAAPPRPAAACDPAHVAVALRHVTVRHAGRDEPVLDDASLTVRPGETVVLTGANGAGKSTTIDLLLGFAAPSCGAVTVGGVDLAGIDPATWRRHLTYLPERPTLLAASLADNLRVGDADAGDERLLDVLDTVGAAQLLQTLPLGLRTPIGDGGHPLSMGERQRVALARALLRRASLHLLDEPTAHLDDATESIVVDALERHLRGRSALIVTHRPAVLRLADRVVVLEAGRFRTRGMPVATAAVPLRTPA